MDSTEGKKSEGKKISRRQLLEGMAAAAAFHIVPGRVLGLNASSNVLNVE